MAGHSDGPRPVFPSHPRYRTGTGEAMLVGDIAARLLQPFGLRNDFPAVFNPSSRVRNDVFDGFDPSRLGTKGANRALERGVRDLQ